MKNKYIFWVLLCLTSCATQGIHQNTIPGFWIGYFHGFTAFWVLIGETFMDNIKIYAYPNSGTSYDFGFVLGFITMISIAVRTAVLSTFEN